MPTIKIHISSKDWEKAEIDVKDKETGEEIRILDLTINDFFFEYEKSKINIEIGFGGILVSKKRFFKELQELKKRK